ncbi:hypothetical protein GOODEAATRI_006852 [Goodea atripinnis]|uniref:Uncharacterized protein n=1 Tax=Goodea atripinnis TaxID=208336 RepID=A0ABV0N0T3_9TELE
MSVIPHFPLGAWLRSLDHSAQATISALTLHARLAYPLWLCPVTLDLNRGMKTRTKEGKQTLTSWQPVQSCGVTGRCSLTGVDNQSSSRESL